MTEVASSEAQVTVWLTKDGGGPLHGGRSIEYVVTLADGRPQSYQRTSYEDGEVVTTDSSTNISAVPPYVREEVEKHMTPRGMWPA